LKGNHHNTGDMDDNGTGARAVKAVTLSLPDLVLTEGDDAVDLLQLWTWLGQGRKFIAGVTALAAVAALAYVLLTPAWYRAEVVLAPTGTASNQSGLAGSLGALGGLGSLVGLGNLSLGGGGTAESIAVLTSTEFTWDFISNQRLLPVLFADDWDAQHGRWKSPDPRDWPDMYDAVKLFDEEVRTVREDKKTGLVTLSIEWKQPQLAAQWANLLVARLNDRVRGRMLEEADAKVGYLKRELSGTEVVALQQAIGRLLETEMQKAMVGRVSKDAAFRVIDPARTPKYRFRPKRLQIVALAAAIGGLLASLAVLVQQNIRAQRAFRDSSTSRP